MILAFVPEETKTAYLKETREDFEELMNSQTTDDLFSI